MSNQDPSAEDRARRGKRLLIYGMFALLLVTFVAVFLAMYLITAPLAGVGPALTTALIVTVIGLVASVIVWFVYTKAILKE